MRGFTSLLVCTITIVACGGDDDGDTQGTASTTLTTAATSEGSSSSDASTSTSSGSEESSSTAIADSSSSEASSSSGDTPEDPEYPAPDGGACPDDFAPIELPGGSVCAPFCVGADAPCPAPASGDAAPVCTPFEGKGGSGLPCTTHDDCTDAEACGVMDTCVAVAFWACRLECDGGQTCSDGMTCAGDACAYP